MIRASFEGLPAILAVAEQRSFTAAAAALGVTPAAVSQAVRAVESRLGVLLFQRTTRRVALTEAGAALLARLKPAAAEIDDAIESLSGFRDRPAGTLRLTVPRIAVPLVIEPVLPDFHRAYPDLAIEIAVQDRAVDIMAEGFDAGIRLGEAIARDMIAVRLTPDIDWRVVGSPAYFARHGRPSLPGDLVHHMAIRSRFPTSGVLYRWEFEIDGRAVTVDPPGAITVNDSALQIVLARGGLGLGYLDGLSVAPFLESGELEAVLGEFTPRGSGFFLYFAARSQTQPKLRAFIDMAVRKLARR